MQIQIKLNEKIVTIFDPNVVVLEQALDLVADALRGVGFQFEGNLEIENTLPVVRTSCSGEY